MAISDFLNFAFLTPNISKHIFLKKNDHKFKIFKNFKKTEYML